jgi:hypothetical protein
MGTWGTGIFDDDLALDLRGEFEDLTAGGSTPGQAADRILRDYEDDLEDMDEGPVILVALASLLLDAGVTDHPLYERARTALESGAGLERWEEAGEKDLAGRKAVYESLLARLPD